MVVCVCGRDDAVSLFLILIRRESFALLFCLPIYHLTKDNTRPFLLHIFLLLSLIDEDLRKEKLDEDGVRLLLLYVCVCWYVERVDDDLNKTIMDGSPSFHHTCLPTHTS